MTIGETLLAIFGIGFGLMIVALVILDCWLCLTGQTTISRRLAAACKVDPIIAVLISGPFFFIAGCLAGHWWFPI